MAAAVAQYYFRFRICWCPCFQKVRIYQQTKFRRHISIYRWDITRSGLEKKRLPYWNSTSGFDLDHFPVICILFCISLPNFVQIGVATAEIWCFIKMAANFPFRICRYHYLQKVKVYQQTKFRRHISIDSWDITTSVFEKQTSAILEFYFRFRARPVRRNLHVILHQATECRPNRSTHCGNMTSYPFLKMAPAAAKYYFRFRICWCHWLQKVKVYQQTKFRRDISIGGWDITTSGFKIQTFAILEFYCRFRSRPFRRNWRVILHPTAEFRPNRNIHCENMTSYRFSRWRSPAMLSLL